MAVLRVASGATQCLSHSVDDKQAFYVAEAGLASAYDSLFKGSVGQIGSLERPARFAGGVVWVDATEREDKSIALRSTGLYSSGRETLEIIVRPVEEPIGIFSKEELVIEAPMLLDGFDSGEGDYFSQIQRGILTVDPSTPFPDLRSSSSGMLLFYKGIYYRFSSRDGNEYTVEAALNLAAHPELGIEQDVYISGEYLLPDGSARVANQYETVQAYFDGLPEPDNSLEIISSIGPTTGGGGILSSNGSIILGSTEGGHSELFGDVVPGPGESVTNLDGSIITGSTTPRRETLELAPVRLPDLELQPAVDHDGATPFVLPPSSQAYESLVVRSDAELWIVGPAEVLAGSLQLDPGATLVIDNREGAVDLFVVDTVSLDAGSRVRTLAQTPGDLSLQVSGAGQVDLHATSQFYGVVYAPEAEVSVESPFEIIGALAGRVLNLSANVRIHFDSGYMDRSALPRLQSWRIEEVPVGVAQTRVDPFNLLDLDESSLDTIMDSTVTRSWFIEMTYLDTSGDIINYSGPVEDMPVGEIEDIHGELVFIAPDREPAGEWLIDIEYRCDNGHIHDYQGPIAEQNINDHPTYITKLVVTPPGG